MSHATRKNQSSHKVPFHEFMLGNETIADITSLLEQGKTILYPTDTIWGIGCDATNPKAIKKIYDIKKRDPKKPLSILVSSIDMLKEYVDDLPPKIETLLSHHIRPLTVIYKKTKNLPDELLPADKSIAIRIAQDAFCQHLIAQFGKPIVSTSANISGEPYPAHFGNISSAVIQAVDYVVRYGRDKMEPAQPSVIITMGENGDIVFLRN